MLISKLFKFNFKLFFRLIFLANLYLLPINVFASESLSANKKMTLLGVKVLPAPVLVNAFY